MESFDTDSSKPSNLVLAVAASIVVSALIAGGGVYAYENSQQVKAKQEMQTQIDSLKSQVITTKQVAITAVPTPVPMISTSSPAPTSTPLVSSTDSYTEWKVYTSKTEGLSFKYPADWKISTTNMRSVGDELAISGPVHTVDGKQMKFDITITSQPISAFQGKTPDCICKIWKEEVMTILNFNKSLAIIESGPISNLSGNDTSAAKVQTMQVEDSVSVTHGYPYAVEIAPYFIGKNGNAVIASGEFTAQEADAQGNQLNILKSISPAAFDADASVVIAKNIFKSLKY